MTNNLEYIDQYFKKELSPEQSGQFEQRITDDPAFAEEVAFFLSTKETLGRQLAVEKKERFRAIYINKEAEAPLVRMNPIRKLWPYISAAAVTIVLIARFVFFNVALSPSELADEYIKENFQDLGGTMGTSMDSIEIGKRYFKEGKFDSAQIYFESILQRDTTLQRDSALFKVTEYAGITCLKQKQYGKAIEYFSRMERVTGMYSNKGMFFHAIGLIERNRPGDKDEAKRIMTHIRDNNLTGSEKAKEWIKNW
ncbi:MAG: hypothetical protein ACKVOW_18860 [Chitinophagaceae bacterium]